MLEKKVNVADHGQRLNVVICEFGIRVVVVVRSVGFQWASEYNEREFWGTC